VQRGFDGGICLELLGCIRRIGGICGKEEGFGLIVLGACSKDGAGVTIAASGTV
jgi:hypothetical protein